MEYVFIRDPIDGFIIQFNDEHRHFARFLNEEIGATSQAVERFHLQITTSIACQTHAFDVRGKETVLTVDEGEVSVMMNQMPLVSHELERLEQEMLTVDSNSDRSECGIDDFLDLLLGWYQFLIDNKV